MKENLHLKRTLTLASLFGLIALLLLSPCKVRNSVQTALEIPQTEVSNKSICQVYEEIETVTSVTKTTQQNAPAFLDLHLQSDNAVIHLSKQTVVSLTDKNESVKCIPYYILFQNLKVHCS